jgi:hypothetical protein
MTSRDLIQLSVLPRNIALICTRNPHGWPFGHFHWLDDVTWFNSLSVLPRNIALTLYRIMFSIENSKISRNLEKLFMR